MTTRVPALSPEVRIAAAVAVGLAGLATMVAILKVFDDSLFKQESLVMIASAFVGAAAAGYPMSFFFGRRAWPGWLFAVAGALLTTTLGGLLGGAVFGAAAMAIEVGWSPLQMVQMSFFSALVVWHAIGTEAAVALTWAGAMVFVHLGVLQARMVRSGNSGFP